MSADEVSKFVSDRKDSAGDLRTVGDHRDSSGARFLSFKDAMTLFRESKFTDWPFSGPRAVKEYLQAVLSGPGDLPTYHLSWVRSSGVGSGSAITHEHRSLCEALRLAITKDQLDVTNLSSFECLIRRLLVLEMAVARSPGSPDFSGLDVVVESPITAHGSVQATAMSSWVTERLKERAQIAKQSRLYREEQAKKPARGGGASEDADDKKRKKKGGPKGGGKGGGAEGSASAS